jgi:hypothetical protein
LWASVAVQAAIQPLIGAAAWVLYRALEPKVVAHRYAKKFDDGNTMNIEFGLAGGLAYRFESATTAYARLVLRGRLELDELRGLDTWE